jgi:hypothetical protein
MIGGSEQSETKEEPMNSRKLQVIKPTPGYPLLWVGFHDSDLHNPDLPDAGELVGVAVVRAEDVNNFVISTARRLGVDPGRDVVWAEINHPAHIPERFVGRLLNEAEHDELSQFWLGRQADAGMH